MSRALIVLLAVTLVLSVLPKEAEALTPAQLQTQATWAIVLASIGLGLFVLMLIVLAVVACRRGGGRRWCRGWCDDDDDGSELEVTERFRKTGKGKNNNASTGTTSNSKMLVAVDS